MKHRLRFARTGTGAVGCLAVGFVLAVALVGPLFAPHDPAASVGLPGAKPSAAAPLGTDAIGRDVLSRTLWGGRSVLSLSLTATLVAYALGTAIGLIAGYSRSLLDAITTRFVDLLWSFPVLLLILLLVAAFGRGTTILLIGVIIAAQAGIIRFVRAATLQASTRGYVEAAVARGERKTAIVFKEILPNILPNLMADCCIRLAFAVFVVAGFNYLGLGIQAPNADWALMMSENRSVLASNWWSVFAPGVVIVIFAIGVNLIGDAVAATMATSEDTPRGGG